jgi:hypothetical protein
VLQWWHNTGCKSLLHLGERCQPEDDTDDIHMKTLNRAATARTAAAGTMTTHVLPSALLLHPNNKLLLVPLLHQPDLLHLLAYGSDVLFYRLLPKAVIKVHSCCCTMPLTSYHLRCCWLSLMLLLHQPDPLHLLAYGSDASFYRLLPKAVIKVHSEGEVQGLLRLSQAHQVPVTFRAAGTSLSGQAVTDSIIISVVSGKTWFRTASCGDS